MTDRDALVRLLEEIDAADDALAKALDARARAYIALHEQKAASPDVFVPMPRDADVMARLRERLSAFPPSAAEPMVREILSGCASLVAPRRVVYLGEPGGFAHLAARRRFGGAASYASAASARDVLDAIERGRSEFGVLPLETSSDGAVTATLLGLEASSARIGGEISVDASYHLLSGSGKRSDVEKVYGAHDGVAACRRFLRVELPHATVIDVPSVEIAAELVQDDAGAAIVGTQLLCDLYDLRIAAEAIEDEHGVHTRYAIVGNELPSRTGEDHTIVAVAVHDAPGALYETLKPFASRGVNLTRLESRPTPQWRYLFFLEMDGHVTDRPVLTALDELRSISRYVKVLGSYPRPTA